MLNSMGNLAALNLRHYKVIGAGEGGMVLAHDETIYARSAIQRDSVVRFQNFTTASVYAIVPDRPAGDRSTRQARTISASDSHA